MPSKWSSIYANRPVTGTKMQDRRGNLLIQQGEQKIPNAKRYF